MTDDNDNRRKDVVLQKIFIGLALLCVAVLVGIHIYHVLKGPTDNSYRISMYTENESPSWISSHPLRRR